MRPRARAGAAPGPALAAALACALAAPACADAPPRLAEGGASAACAGCHPEQHGAWRLSAHALGGSPLLDALLPRVAAAWGAEAAARCVACHAPGHAPDGGIGCVSCHAAVGYAAERDGLLLVDLGAPLMGPLGDPAPTPAHASRRSDLLAAPELCGACHEVTGPGLLDEPTLTEHRASPAAAAGRTCASCHLPPRPPGPAAAGGPPDGPRRDHAVTGFDPPWGAAPAEAAEAAARTRALLATALALSAEEVPAGPGEAAALRVTLRHAEAGHRVPTGAAFLRDVWVEVAVVDAGGAEVLRLGARDPEGRLVGAPPPLRLGGGATRAGAPVALPTDADALAPATLAPGEAATARVGVPAGARAPLRATVSLRARAVRPEILDALGLAALAGEVPTHALHAVELPLGRSPR